MTRPSTAAPILAMLAIVLVTLGAYLGGYFWLGERWELLNRDTPAVGGVERRFGQQWLCTVFVPAAWIEEKVMGIPVVLRHASPEHQAEQAIGMPPMPGTSEGSADSPLP